MKGTIKKFDDAKGYGFITSTEVEGDVFLHYTSIVKEGYKTIEIGAEVEFDLVTTDKGNQARNVIKIIKE